LFFLFLHGTRTTAMRSLQTSQDALVNTHADDEVFPFMVSLQEISPHNNKMIHTCGGVIISPDYALTAADCFADYQVNKPDRVISGSVDLASGGFLHLITEKVIYENYMQDSKYYNLALALIKVSPPFNTSLPGVKAIRMVKSHKDAAQFASTGWGATEEGYGDNVYPKVLQVKQSELASNKYCNYFYLNITSHQICTQNRVGEGMCSRDEGNPLIFVSKTNGMFLLGIATKLHFCGNGFPDIYTKVWPFRAWINGVCKCLTTDN